MDMGPLRFTLQPVFSPTLAPTVDGTISIGVVVEALLTEEDDVIRTEENNLITPEIE